MNSASPKQCRRRTIARDFLSNISLDSELSIDETSSDVPFERTYGSNRSLFYSFVDEGLFKIGITGAKKGACLSSENVDELFMKTVQTECAGSSVQFRERANTGASDYVRHSDLKGRKHALHQASLAEDSILNQYFSSSESISSGRNRCESLGLNKCREIRVLQPSSLQHCRGERMMLLTPKTKTPFYVFSFIPYKKVSKSKLESKKEAVGRKRNLSSSKPLAAFADSLDPLFFLHADKHQDDHMVSYRQFLVPSRTIRNYCRCQCYTNKEYSDDIEQRRLCSVRRCMSIDMGASGKLNSCVPFSASSLEFKGTEFDDVKQGYGTAGLYSPFLLDDPDFLVGGHRTVVTFTTYRTSVIDYVKPSELKKCVNEKFKERFPHIQLTLTKLRSLKREMRKVAKVEGNVDSLTVAQAYVYFEKLILKNVVNKSNRKLCAAVCIILSAKMNDTKRPTLKLLFEKVESAFRVSHKEILAMEFRIFAILEFGLHLHNWEVLPHFQQLLCES